MANNNPFYQFWQRPNASHHILLAEAHDWFQRYFPGSMPFLKDDIGYKTLQARLRIPATLTAPEGSIRDLGQIQFLAQVHVKDGFIALRLSEFVHQSTEPGIPGVGGLGQSHPGNHPRISPADWTTIKQTAAETFRSYFDTFDI